MSKWSNTNENWSLSDNKEVESASPTLSRKVDDKKDEAMPRAQPEISTSNEREDKQFSRHGIQRVSDDWCHVMHGMHYNGVLYIQNYLS